MSNLKKGLSKSHAPSSIVTGKTVTQCSHCGWRGTVDECGHDEGCLPVEGRCPFCRQVFTCKDADQDKPSDPLEDWVATKLTSLRTVQVPA